MNRFILSKIKPININQPIIYDNEYNNKIDEFCNIYNIDKDQLNNPKIEFRYFCYRYLDYIRSYNLIDIELNKKLEAVLIEYRLFPHLEFIIRNAIIKLGIDWSFTVLCGNLNYEFILNMCSKIHQNIKVIKTPYDNLNQSTYSTFMSSLDFWNMFSGEKILIYQEDSCIFKTNINDFLEWDYIGAPWPKNQNDNPNCVGNGGFSLRTKKCMIDVINKISIKDTEYNSSTLEYMNNTGMDVGPEDVYFSLNMIKYNIGRVADWDTAFKFSSESYNNNDSLGGHNFWLNDKEWNKNLYFRIFNNKIITAISSPYGLNMGGGELNLLNFAKYFITIKNSMIYLFITENMNIIKETIINHLGYDYLQWFRFYQYDKIYKYINIVDYHFDMYNCRIPYNIGCSLNKNNNLFHCQFPFDINSKITNIHKLKRYKNIIVNSDFTKEYYNKYMEEYLQNKKIHIIYPCCFNKINPIKYDKVENVFVMIGRIFDYNPDANNKNFDIALEYFEKISNEGYDNFKIYIIGQVYSENMLQKIKNFKIKNIEICTNIPNNIKNDILKKSKYIINMVGINRDINLECYAYEHFGISILEGLNYGCIPISINGGYPAYYINENTGIIFNNENEFYNIIKEIIINNKEYKYNYEFYNNFLKKFTFNNFINSINKII